MKKKLILVGQFFSRNKIKTFLLLIVMLSASIFIIQITSSFEYNLESLKFFEGDDIKNADLVSIYSDLDSYFLETAPSENDESGEWEELDSDQYNDQYKKLLDQNIYDKIKKFPAVSAVYYYTIEDMGAMKYKNTETDMYFAELDTYKRFPYALSSGQWFSSSESSGEYPDAVVCGPNFANVNVGDDIEVSYYNKNKQKIHIIGKVAAPYKTMDLNGDFTKGLSYSNKVFFLNEEKTLKAFGETINRNPTRAIVVYKPDAQKSMIEECRKYYESFFADAEDLDLPGYDPCDEMLEQGENTFISQTKGLLGQYGIFILTGTVMFLILSILMVKSKQREYNMYLMFGSTKRTNFLFSLIGILIIAFVAGLISTVYLILFSYAVTNGLIVSSNFYYVGVISYLSVWAYLLLNVIIAAFIPYIMIKRKSMNLITLKGQ